MDIFRLAMEALFVCLKITKPLTACTQPIQYIHNTKSKTLKYYENTHDETMMLWYIGIITVHGRIQGDCE